MPTALKKTPTSISVLSMNIRDLLNVLSSYDPNLEVTVRIDGFTTSTSCDGNTDLTHCPELTAHHPLASQNINIVWDGNTDTRSVELAVRSIVPTGLYP